METGHLPMMPLNLDLEERDQDIKKDHLTKVKINIINNCLESDEPLHLCISSKFADRYNTACNLVQNLVTSVQDEYKKFCDRTGKTPVPCLAIRKEEGLSTKKGTSLKSELDM